MSVITSDPHAWLRPIYARLAHHPAFQRFDPSHQFEQLVQAVERDHPSKAAEMREWSAGGQHCLLLHLASRLGQQETGEQVELWRVRKSERELRCVAHYLPTGIDVRLLEADGGFRRTQLRRDVPEVERLSGNWRNALLKVGWS